MNVSKKKAFQEYKDRHHKEIRQIKEGLNLSSHRRFLNFMSIIKAMNNVFAHAKTRRGVPPNGPKFIFRGLQTNPLMTKNYMNNKSFSSWTSNQNVARIFKNQGNNGVVLKLNTGNLKNIPVVSYKNNINRTNVESEYILPPMKFKVVTRGKNYVNVSL